jgi:hypothetical protein
VHLEQQRISVRRFLVADFDHDLAVFQYEADKAAGRV